MIGTEAVLDGYANRFINGLVSRLVRRAGFTESDRDDLRQSFRLNLLERSHQYDPSKTWEAFVTVVCKNHYVDLIEKRMAEMRSPHRESVSLDESLPSGGRIADATAHDQSRNHRQVQSRSGPSQWELAEDTRTVLDDMPPIMRKACEILMRDPKRKAESELGISHGKLYEILDRALVRFDRASMRDHLRL